MPIQTEIFDRSDIPGTELRSVGPPGEPEQKNNTDNHVQRVHAGHREIEEEENLCLLRHIRRQRLFLQPVRVRVDKLGDIKACTRNVVQLELLLVLNVLDAKKSNAEQRSEHTKYNQKALLSNLLRPHTQRHEKAGANQNRRVRRA